MAMTGKRSHGVRVVFGIVAVAAVVAAQATLGADALNPGVVPVNQKAFGTTYADLSARWWQWVLGIRTSKNPQLDKTGKDCGVNQSERVWFLAGTFGGDPVVRSCTVPAEAPLFIPVVNVVAFDPFPNETVDDLRNQAAAFIDGVSVLEARIDGVSVVNLQNYRVQSPVFSFVVPEHGLIGPGLHTPAVSDGIWLLLRPLEPGTHVLHVRAVNGDFVVDVTYNLTVVREE